MQLFSFAGLLTILLSLAPNSHIKAQKALVLEKATRIKTDKLYAGEVLTFRKTGEREWRSAAITRFIPEENIVVFDNQFVKLSEFSAIKTFKNRGWSRAVSTSLFTFGTAWVGFTAGDEIADPDHAADWEVAAYVAGTAVVSGLLIRSIFKSKTIKLGKRYRLRLIDLSIVPN